MSVVPILRMDENTYLEAIQQFQLTQQSGKISKSVGMIFEGHLPDARLGSLVSIHAGKENIIEAEVIGFRERKVVLMALDEIRGVNTNSQVYIKQQEPKINVGEFLLGRVIDPNGMPLDESKDSPPLFTKSDLLANRVHEIGIYNRVGNPMERELIDQPLDLGIRAMNGFLTCGRGQRLGIMAGSGVGKSTLLGMLSRYASADVNVIALIGERGREVREFIEKDLGPEGMKKSIVVVATSDKSPLLRIRGAFTACAISEYFRSRGANVLLMMDSITRFCMAQREVGLSLGEPPASKGYTPSVFSTLPKLLERAGNWGSKGSITGIYTVLVDGDDMDEPIADAARSILDGHIVLSRNLAHRNHYPPIDISSSISRCMNSVISSTHLTVAKELRNLLALYNQNEDLINIGAYAKGANPKLDQAVLIMDRFRKFLLQPVHERSSIDETVNGMKAILAAAGIHV